MLLIVSVLLCTAKYRLQHIVKTHKVVGIAITKALHLGQGNLKHKYRAGRDWEQPRQGGRGVCGERKARHEPSMCACSPENQLCPGLQQRTCSQQVKGDDSAPLFYTHETPPGVLFSTQHKSIDLLEQVQRGVTRMIRGLEYFSCEEELRDLRLFCLKKRRL